MEIGSVAASAIVLTLDMKVGSFLTCCTEIQNQTLAQHIAFYSSHRILISEHCYLFLIQIYYKNKKIAVLTKYKINEASTQNL